MEDNKPLPIDHELPETIRYTRALLTLLLFVLVALRLFILVMTEHPSTFYVIGQGIYTLSWAAIGFFMLHCSMYMHARCFHKLDLNYMKKISFIAMVCCLARVIVASIAYWPIVTANNWVSVHNVLEIVVWLVLAFFFGKYWRIRAEHESLNGM